jgi:3-oxoadipate enol-lactonase
VTSELHHRFDGPEDAPVVVLSNSLGMALEMWEEQVPALSERFRVLRYDQRGHGGTPASSGPYAIADLARDALALLDELGLERVAFCGCSLGGMTGLWLAINAADRIDRLALCCTTAHLPPREMWIERAATAREQGMEPLVEGALERWFTPALAERRPEVLEDARRMLLAADPEGYAGCCEAIADHDLRASLGRIEAATLIIAGADDPATPPDHARMMEAGIDGARLVVLDDARHLANIERPDDVNRELLQHLTAGVRA